MNATLGIVVIGRNEGANLRRCLLSITGARNVMQSPLVYVDSGSTDQSVAAATECGAAVVQLDPSRPFSAARARNEGFAALSTLGHGCEFVQFIDGDCTIVDGWLSEGTDALRANPDIAAVFGRLRERSPQSSIFNQLCDIEWATPLGNVQACGGIAMFRTAAFRAVGGFDTSIQAGEEPELCMRLRKQNWRIVRLPSEMATHDASLNRFSQWWKRQVRGGSGALDVAVRFEHGPETRFTRQVRSARLWTLGWIAWCAVLITFGWSIGGAVGIAIGFAGAFSVLALQTVRLSVHNYRSGRSMKLSLIHAMLTILGKWAQLQGQVRYLWSQSSRSSDVASTVSS